MNQKIIADIAIQYQQCYFSKDGLCFVTIYKDTLTIHTLHDNIHQTQEYNYQKFNDRFSSKIVFFQDCIIWAYLQTNKITFIRMEQHRNHMEKIKLQLTTETIQPTLKVNFCDRLPENICEVFQRSYFPLTIPKLFRSDIVIETGYGYLEIILMTGVPKILIQQEYHDSALNKIFKVLMRTQRFSGVQTILMINRYSYHEKRFSKNRLFYYSGHIIHNLEFNSSILLLKQPTKLKLFTCRGQIKIIRNFITLHLFSKILLSNNYVIDQYQRTSDPHNTIIYNTHILDIRTARGQLFQSQENYIGVSQNYLFEQTPKRIRVYEFIN